LPLDFIDKVLRPFPYRTIFLPHFSSTALFRCRSSSHFVRSQSKLSGTVRPSFVCHSFCPFSPICFLPRPVLPRIYGRVLSWMNPKPPLRSSGPFFFQFPLIEGFRVGGRQGSPSCPSTEPRFRDDYLSPFDPSSKRGLSLWLSFLLSGICPSSLSYFSVSRFGIT